jgi:hypothetical protein
VSRRILLLAALFCFPQKALAAPRATSIKVFVDSDQKAHRETNLTVPAGSNTLDFLVNPKSLRFRYKLEGLDEDWNKRTDTISVRVRWFRAICTGFWAGPIASSSRGGFV